MKKLCSLLLTGAFILLPIKIKEIVTPNKEMFFYETKIKNEYLEKKTTEFFYNQTKKNIKQKIIEELKNKEHTYREKDSTSKINPSENPFIQIDSLSNDQIKIIYLMLENLKDKKFRKEIGKIIIDDIEDQYSEHGGIIEFKNQEKLKLNVFESELIKSKEYNNNYLAPEKIDSMEYLAEFHLHASSYNEKEFAGPSPIDIIIQEAKLYKRNYIHEFVITSLKKGKFNLDYYGADKTIGKKSKIIDLGNYDY